MKFKQWAASGRLMNLISSSFLPLALNVWEGMSGIPSRCCSCRCFFCVCVLRSLLFVCWFSFPWLFVRFFFRRVGSETPNRTRGGGSVFLEYQKLVGFLSASVRVAVATEESRVNHGQEGRPKNFTSLQCKQKRIITRYRCRGMRCVCSGHTGGKQAKGKSRKMEEEHRCADTHKYTHTHTHTEMGRNTPNANGPLASSESVSIGEPFRCTPPPPCPLSLAFFFFFLSRVNYRREQKQPTHTHTHIHTQIHTNLLSCYFFASFSLCSLFRVLYCSTARLGPDRHVT